MLSAVFGRLIETMLFGVRPLDLTTFVFVTIVLGITAALSIAAPAWRAARIDPSVALRNREAPAGPPDEKKGLGDRKAPASERGQHVLDGGELQARAAAGLSVAALQRVETPPVRIGHGKRLARQEERFDRGSVRLRRVPVRPCSRSATIEVTVSAESGLLVPMTPLGPRLIQPATYTPGTGFLISGPSPAPARSG